MPAFRDYPITWLFWIATACLDILAIRGLANRESGWFSAVAIGQMWIAGGWLAVGASHRLIRAAFFLLAPITLALADYMNPSGGMFATQVVWREVLGASLFVTDVAAATTMLVMGVNALVSRRDESSFDAKLQFPLIELFGWTIITAVASLTIRAARFEFLTPDIFVASFALGAVPAVAIAQWGGERTRISLVYLTLLTLLVAILAAFASSVVVFRAGIDWPTVLGAYAYVAAWLVILRMDNTLRQRREEPPSLSIAVED